MKKKSFKLNNLKVKSFQTGTDTLMGGNSEIGEQSYFCSDRTCDFAGCSDRCWET